MADDVTWPWWHDWRPTPAIRLSAAWHVAAAAALPLWPSEWPALLGAVALNHAALAAIGSWPRSTALGANRTRLPAAAAARGEVALTFDDGPDEDVTPRILGLLREAGATASFFCIGARAAAHPELVREIVRRGHTVENHTQVHSNFFACRSVPALQREIGTAQRALAALAGRKPRFFRPPMGIRSPMLDMALAGSGLAAVAWTRRGYDTVRRDPPRVLASLTNGLAAGDILLLHDGSCARTAAGGAVSVAVLPALLDEIDRSGLRAVSLDQAVALSDPS